MRGPSPKPTALKRLQGTFRGDRAVRNEAQPAPGLPPCPKGLSPAARKEYRRTGKRLLAAGLMTKLDGPLLAGFAAVWSRWLDAEAELLRTGPVIRSPERLSDNVAVPGGREFLPQATAALCRRVRYVACE